MNVFFLYKIKKLEGIVGHLTESGELNEGFFLLKYKVYRNDRIGAIICELFF